MTWYLLRRLGAVVTVLLVLSAIVYALFYLTPGDPAVLACGRGCNAERLALTREKLGLAEPVYAQYWHFLEGLVAGRDYAAGPDVDHCAAPCLGYSFQSDQPVLQLITSRFPVSLSLAFGAEVVALLLGVSAGLLSALRQGRPEERLLTGVTLVGYATPVFLVGLLLLMVFCAYLQWLPFPAYVPLTENPGEWARNLILPWAALGLIQAAVFARITRAGALETLVEDHIRTFRAYGLRERQVIRRHALRGALTPLITITAVEVAQMMTASVLTETMFGLPGVGRLTVESVGSVDLPVVVGVTLLAGTAVVLSNAVADVLSAVADPRVKLI
ncbi:ABC transporter permease [Actinomadura macrotermitis]|uniref:Glutathione transport system permease protein GsiC n=1 Tax=Actinomadura macrotermitis TaxID=2585200 RepID=A0A7K0BNI5_9ACTN|nr:ABC transporter permease [Actinomadura macrotermitis]MQY02697.1 Glutathione transport system permease protein GsiC [Actinomadura macrotermitis]